MLFDLLKEYNFIKSKLSFCKIFLLLLGIGDGDWGLGPIPNPQSPIPNPQSPLLNDTNI